MAEGRIACSHGRDYYTAVIYTYFAMDRDITYKPHRVIIWCGSSSCDLKQVRRCTH